MSLKQLPSDSKGSYGSFIGNVSQANHEENHPGPVGHRGRKHIYLLAHP
jgi:hypothetical protein